MSRTSPQPDTAPEAAQSAAGQDGIPSAGAAPVKFSEIVDRYESPLLRYVMHLIGPAEAEDVVQDVFLRLHRTLSRSGPESIGNLSRWLFAVAHNAAIDAAKDGARRTPAVPASPDGEALDQLSALVRRAACERALEEMRRLPDVQRQVLLLKVVQGMTLREIGDVAGLSPSNVAYHLEKALTELARRLKAANVM
jgi:RNA polymerase sigma-70 factor, ECF subfamily